MALKVREAWVWGCPICDKRQTAIERRIRRRRERRAWRKYEVDQ